MVDPERDVAGGVYSLTVATRVSRPGDREARSVGHGSVTIVARLRSQRPSNAAKPVYLV